MEDRNEIIKKLKESIFNFGNPPSFIANIDVKKGWNKFNAIENDLIKKVDIPDNNAFVVVYKTTDKEGMFANHTHPIEEYGMVLKGRIIIHTPYKIEVKKIGDSYLIPRNIPHKVKFDKNTDIVIMFHPGFESGNWEADFDDHTIQKAVEEEALKRKSMSVFVKILLSSLGLFALYELISAFI